jgi:hypothetical protein
MRRCCHSFSKSLAYDKKERKITDFLLRVLAVVELDLLGARATPGGSLARCVDRQGGDFAAAPPRLDDLFFFGIRGGDFLFVPIPLLRQPP